MSAVEAQVDKLSLAEKSEPSPVADSQENEKPATESTESTVLESTDFSVIHPLTYKWTLWYLKPAQGTDDNWADLLKELVTVSSVEEFWGAFNSVPRVTSLPLRADFAFFKQGIRPEWEDEANKNGGRWAAQLRLSEEMDGKWLNTLLSLIGNTLDTEDQVNGVFAMVRPKGALRIQLWVKGDAQSSQKAARNLKNALNMNDKMKLEFQPFNKPDAGGLTVKIEL